MFCGFLWTLNCSCVYFSGQICESACIFVYASTWVTNHCTHALATRKWHKFGIFASQVEVVKLRPIRFCHQSNHSRNFPEFSQQASALWNNLSPCEWEWEEWIELCSNRSLWGNIDMHDAILFQIMRLYKQTYTFSSENRHRSATITNSVHLSLVSFPLIEALHKLHYVNGILLAVVMVFCAGRINKWCTSSCNYFRLNYRCQRHPFGLGFRCSQRFKLNIIW